MKRDFCKKIQTFFGLANIICISSEHRIGIENVMNTLVDLCQENELGSKEKDKIDHEEKPINIAIVGRPNVGKSTLVNSIVKQQRFVTGPEAGLTRDTNFVFFQLGQ
ncbi:MAG: GTPase [Paracoccaceae bacterium]